jgi:hypothetical protein
LKRQTVRTPVRAGAVAVISRWVVHDRHCAQVSQIGRPGLHEAAASRNSGLSSSVRRLNTGQLSLPRRNAPAR